MYGQDSVVHIATAGTCMSFTYSYCWLTCVQELAARIMATLEWLNGSHQLQYARTPAHAQLNKLLVLFLNNLVAGHMLDPQLHTQKLHDVMVAPLLADTTPLGRLNFRPLSNLRSVILKRVTEKASGAGRLKSSAPTVSLSSLRLQG